MRRRIPAVSDLSARIASYEIGLSHADRARRKRWISAGRAEETKKLYGLDQKISEPFGRQCLLARRMIERGVRFVQLYSGSIVNQNMIRGTLTAASWTITVCTRRRWTSRSPV